MKIAHNQPHLVPPMKLVFYEEMPASPLPIDRSSSRVSQWASSSRGLANRASDRASQTLLKRRRTTFGTKQLVEEAETTRRRVQPFRPLELSIYLPDNRLSDLPEFDMVDFTSTGEIQLPPKALVRAKSEAVLTRTPSPTSPRKAYQSMVDDRTMEYWRPESPVSNYPRNAQIIEQPSIQRSSVVWPGLPGLPTPTSTEMSGANNTPTPRATQPEPIVSDQLSMILTFPPIEREEPIETSTPVRPPRVSSLGAPVTTPTSPPPSRLGTPNGRVSQWLQRTSSNNTVTSRTSRRSRKGPSKLSISAPMPISDRPATMSSMALSNTHSRTRTTSSSTVASTVMSSILMDAASVSTYTTMNSNPMPPVPKTITTSAAGSDGQVTPRQMKMARKGSDSSHWNYLPAQYAEVWKRETIVSQADVGMAI